MAREGRWLEWDSEDLDEFFFDLGENTQAVSHKRQEPGNQGIFEVFLYLSCPPEHRDPVRYFSYALSIK